ncbi:hypothetical protein GCM10011322_13000 [Salinarimonas ramus]|uniref:Uncharacterized protein n=2 Tax=Salinarimonas ramus TaxID=690164 RepID=A0A917Q679_9HYPH|nr:hypothetical protein GCM10011322_13000 [Salinarimonas ramus]
MDGPTHQELDAKIALVEARLDARLVGLDGKIDRLADQISGMVEIGNVRFADMKADADGMRQDFAMLRSEFDDLRSETRSARLTIIIAVVGTGIALFAALTGTISGYLTAFQAGLSVLSVSTVEAADMRTATPRPSTSLLEPRP